MTRTRTFVTTLRTTMTVAVVGAVTAAGLMVGTGSTAAATGTVSSPFNLLTKNEVDIRSATARYQPAIGQIDASITLWSRPVRGAFYSVRLYGPAPRFWEADRLATLTTTPTAGLQLSSRSGATVTIPARIEFRGQTVTFFARDDRLRTLPLRFFDTQTSSDAAPSSTNFFGMDATSSTPLR